MFEVKSLGRSNQPPAPAGTLIIDTFTVKMMAAIKDIFLADQGLVDDRQALFTFAIPGLEGVWGFFPPTLAPWKVLAFVSCTGSAVPSNLLLMLVQSSPVDASLIMLRLSIGRAAPVYHPVYLCGFNLVCDCSAKGKFRILLDRLGSHCSAIVIPTILLVRNSPTTESGS
jgi:hypothetical protein